MIRSIAYPHPNQCVRVNLFSIDRRYQTLVRKLGTPLDEPTHQWWILNQETAAHFDVAATYGIFGHPLERAEC